jgi:peptidyl-tRNA hydrolase
MLKCYILLKDHLKPNQAMQSAAHGVLAMYHKFQDDQDVQRWLQESARKVICSVSEAEFAYAKTYFNYVVVTEPALGDADVALVFKPREDWPFVFRNYFLYGSPKT